jgi:hypothetical protein
MYTRNQVWWDKIPSILIVTDIGFSDEVRFFCEHSSLYLNVAISRKDTDFTKIRVAMYGARRVTAVTTLH